MQKRYSIDIAKQFYWNHSSAWMFSCEFAAFSQGSFIQEDLWGIDSESALV